MLTWTTSGESHGRALIALVDGMPAHVPVTSDDIAYHLARRRLGYGRGARMSFEQDDVSILGGVRWGKTLGGPISVMIENSEWPKWTTLMSADPIDAEDEEVAAALASGRGARLTRPRPGHADYAGMLKYDFHDARCVLERSSARETAARVAAGTIARSFLRAVLGVEVYSHVVSIGNSLSAQIRPTAADSDRVDASPVRTYDKQAEASMIAEIDAAKKSGDTLGGIVEVLIDGLPIGLGSHVSAESRLDAQLAAALMSIQAVKGVEIGDGFAQARMHGSVAHDEFAAPVPGVLPTRTSNHAGGLEGGMTNGEQLVVRAAMKPISTVPRSLHTIDMDTGEAASAIHQRSDVCAVPACAVVAESMVALVIARVVLHEFGGNTVDETAKRVACYRQSVEKRLLHGVPAARS